LLQPGQLPYLSSFRGLANSNGVIDVRDIAHFAPLILRSTVNEPTSTSAPYSVLLCCKISRLQHQSRHRRHDVKNPSLHSLIAIYDLFGEFHWDPAWR
jgi:hypothetical protein